MVDATNCALCGCPEAPLVFYPGASLREARCPACHASRRTRDLGAVFLLAISGGPVFSPDRQLPLLRRLRIFELQAQGALHSLLKSLPGFVCSDPLIMGTQGVKSTFCALPPL